MGAGIVTWVPDQHAINSTNQFLVKFLYIQTYIYFSSQEIISVQISCQSQNQKRKHIPACFDHAVPDWNFNKLKYVKTPRLLLFIFSFNRQAEKTFQLGSAQPSLLNFTIEICVFKENRWNPIWDNPGGGKCVSPFCFDRNFVHNNAIDTAAGNL